MNTLLSVLEASPDAAREWLEAGQIPESLDAWNALERLGSRGLSPELRKWLSTQTSSTAVWLDSAALEAEDRFEEAAARLRTIRESLSGDVKALAMVASARNLLRAGKVSEAWIPLREAAKITDNSALLRAASRLLSRARKIEPAPSRRKLRLAILTSFTADFLTPLVDVCCFGVGIDAQLYVGPFNQYQQEILSPGSGLAAFRPEVVLLAADWRSLGLADEEPDPKEAVEERVERFTSLWQACRERWSAFVIQANFEVPADDPMGRLGGSLAGGRQRLIETINLRLRDAEQRTSGAAIFDLDHVAALWGKDRWHDSALWHTAKQYPAAEALGTLARHLGALLRAFAGLTAKCIALDLDGVLWGGVIGEDGVDGIDLGGSPVGESFVDFQKYLQSLSRRGILLAVCSKNNPEDGLAPFRQHPEMILKESDISCFAVNWRHKDENLREIAETLNIGIDSILFVDDNPVECGRVRQNIPEIEVLNVPRDPAQYVRALSHTLLFESLALTSEDRLRTASIRENVERKAAQSSAGGIDRYLEDLDMHVVLAPFDQPNLPRIVQLINKTNQFNLTTRRKSSEEVARLIDDGAFTLSMRVEDRFGDSGLTGVLIALEKEGDVYIDTWLMSCRVLGRRLDEVMFAAVTRYAGSRRIVGEFIPTAKNSQVADLYPRLGFATMPDVQGRLFVRPAGIYESPSMIRITDLTVRP